MFPSEVLQVRTGCQCCLDHTRLILKSDPGLLLLAGEGEAPPLVLGLTCSCPYLSPLSSLHLTTLPGGAEAQISEPSVSGHPYAPSTEAEVLKWKTRLCVNHHDPPALDFPSAKWVQCSGPRATGFQRCWSLTDWSLLL